MKFKNSTLSQDANKVDFSVCERCFGDALKIDRIYDEPLPNKIIIMIKPIWCKQKCMHLVTLRILNWLVCFSTPVN